LFSLALSSSFLENTTTLYSELFDEISGDLAVLSDVTVAEFTVTLCSLDIITDGGINAPSTIKSLLTGSSCQHPSSKGNKNSLVYVYV
jgi:hypothetical protein